MNIDIKADETLWRNTMLPEGFVTKWLVADGELAKEGHGIAVVRIEGALHDIVAPCHGRVKIETGVNHVIEPGSLLATLVPA
ncbi:MULTISPECIES: biotin/lipoyl-containing protein [unclassified Bradyrhizobium]|uniref:biotin/lipoyl-containing protein n=1 Tax=unclassified Bradyrhizobium TaxID=2631580 RepID=UPI001BA6B194|nr:MULTISPECIES: biotin/lipoyl-containing protein [unclassified Bradyrhizobium]MBR1203710.1 biotin attachment protein [Bradyrhizobium sp. AUGA SZCCT0124]MBR1310403.1 biotin attachment protein [Bradyrhizobium sp. AUGA SZCCT0051]MBR1340546.1 biotin attachment protein [Bradyrhizobium sp. AUGA SZCCT0105]MBR1355152.1 biotin attachment protein [Bradyrhizobium sp. AUGA SZCCT0045]